MSALRACLAVLLVAFAVGCDNGPPPVCDELTPCEGFGEICLEGQCVVEECNSNLDCPMEHVCGVGGRCEVGCDNDRDCYPGNICDLETATCESRGCTDTHIDCGFKEFCNTATGDCYDAGGVYCRPCDPRNRVQDCNGGDENGANECWNNYCTVDCSNGRECPSGFQCYPFSDRSGNVVSFQCLTYCWLYGQEEAGASDIAPPPPPEALPWGLPLQPECAASALLPAPRGDG